ncbi:hypothetical protein DFH08DRAFT_808922 [Mycena albidolilacea]|uniref:Uncharacterized protein n=1 Tax=Mycena albidolilacea TaxID=1033008 RepID=A0AAD7A2F7_9AGAR|nr:hypothetical protein DFH08DRAFT_808922 [Mycena albidolilacea]
MNAQLQAYGSVPFYRFYNATKMANFTQSRNRKDSISTPTRDIYGLFGPVSALEQCHRSPNKIEHKVGLLGDVQAKLDCQWRPKRYLDLPRSAEIGNYFPNPPNKRAPEWEIFRLRHTECMKWPFELLDLSVDGTAVLTAVRRRYGMLGRQELRDGMGRLSVRPSNRPGQVVLLDPTSVTCREAVIELSQYQYDTRRVHKSQPIPSDPTQYRVFTGF